MALTLNPFSLAKFRIIPLLSLVVLVASKTFQKQKISISTTKAWIPSEPLLREGTAEDIWGWHSCQAPHLAHLGAHRNLPSLLCQVQLHIPQGSHGTLPAKEGTQTCGLDVLWVWWPP